MISNAIVSMVLLASFAMAGCALIPQPTYFPRKGEPNTITYMDTQSGKDITIYNLAGMWIGKYVGPDQEIKITQTKNNVTALTLTGDRYRKPGAIVFRGLLRGNLIEGEFQGCREGGDYCWWVPLYGLVKNNAIEIELDFSRRPTSQSASYELYRKARE